MQNPGPGFAGHATQCKNEPSGRLKFLFWGYAKSIEQGCEPDIVLKDNIGTVQIPAMFKLPAWTNLS